MALTIGIATAIIMAVVAVLESHMERKADVTIMPSSTRVGLVPVLERIALDIRWSRP
jgi:hypothetical protein